jgi:phosphoglycerol transferase MdoB-like AlkP superfamily enzyme
MRNFFLPRIIKWVLLLFVFCTVILSAFRLIFFYHFQSSGITFKDSLLSFWLGIRYDARLVAIILVPILVLGNLKQLNPFNNSRAKKIWFWYLGILLLVILILFGVDFYYYDYLTQRLNSNILNFMEDAGISMRMMWQSYPLLRILLFLFIVFIFLMWMIRKLYNSVTLKHPLSRTIRISSFAVVFLFFGLCIYGKIQRFPLRWSDAFTLGNNYKANLALNPFQSFFSSLNFRHSDIDIKKVRKYYPYMAEYLEVQNPDSIQLNFTRVISSKDTFHSKTNVILVLCESFSAYKSSMWKNPLNATPFFDSFSRKGLFFDRCFTPHFGTARGVWATVTGVPDVQLVKTASRNPAAVEQQTIMNDFQGYEKFYFLGGNASWANIRGLLTNNIQNLHLYEEDDYSTPKIDVWGISDLNLFMEANKILTKQDKPFFAIIQTSDNHRPYTIPEADIKEFKKVSGISIDTLKRYGFESIEELNAFRYTDFCFRKFIEAAGKEKYMENTLFVFAGDHGIRSKYPVPMFPQAWLDQGLSCEHVPLLFYCPALLQSQRVSTIASQVDILPTIAGIIDASYTNTGMGKDLYKNLQADNYAFIIDHDTKQIGVVHGDYYFGRHISSGAEDFVSIINNNPIQKNPISDSIRLKMSLMTNAFYETARYLLLNNRKTRY